MSVEANGHSYAAVPGKIPGAAINLGGIDFVLAPLNLDGVRAAEPLLEKFKDISSAADTITCGAQIVILSLQRNYPNITIEEVTALLDIGNVRGAVMKACGVSGMLEGAPGEVRPTSA